MSLKFAVGGGTVWLSNMKPELTLWQLFPKAKNFFVTKKRCLWVSWAEESAGQFLSSLHSDSLNRSQFSSVQLLSRVPTFCSPMDGSMPGFPVHHHLPELAKTHMLWVGDAIQPSRPVVPFSSYLYSFLASGSFPVNWLLASGGQSIGASASASTSILSMNIQDWFHLGLTGLISFQSSELSRVFSNTTVQKHQSQL